MAEGLSQEYIAGLLSGTRQRGAGVEVLNDFNDSGLPGIEVDLSSGPLAGKTADQAKATLDNTKKQIKQTENGTVMAHPEFGKIRVIKKDVSEDPKVKDFRVFLINTELIDLPG